MQNSRRRYPRARADLRLKPAGGQLALAGGPGGGSQPLSFIAALVLTYCDGRHDARAIGDLVARSPAVSGDPEAIRADVQQIIRRFAESGVLV